MGFRASIAVVTIIVLSASIISCSEDDNPVTPHDIPDVIMPLELGNSWVYQLTTFKPDGSIRRTDTVTFSVFSDTLIENERWFVWGQKVTTQVFCTNRTDGLWYWHENDTVPGLSAMYPAEAGDRFTDAYCDTIHVVSTDHLVTVPGGTFSCFLYEKPPAHHQQAQRWRYRGYFSPNIGQIRVEQFLASDAVPEYLNHSFDLISYSIGE